MHMPIRLDLKETSRHFEKTFGYAPYVMELSEHPAFLVKAIFRCFGIPDEKYAIGLSTVHFFVSFPPSIL